MSPLLFCFIMSPFLAMQATVGRAQGRRWVGDHVGSGKPLPFIICPFQGRGGASWPVVGRGAPVRGLYYRIGACPYLWQVHVTLPL